MLEPTPNVQETEFGNLNYKAEINARLSGSTFFVTEDEANPLNATSRSEFEKWAQHQDTSIADKEMIFVKGYIGPVSY